MGTKMTQVLCSKCSDWRGQAGKGSRRDLAAGFLWVSLKPQGGYMDVPGFI